MKKFGLTMVFLIVCWTAIAAHYANILVFVDNKSASKADVSASIQTKGNSYDFELTGNKMFLDDTILQYLTTLSDTDIVTLKFDVIKYKVWSTASIDKRCVADLTIRIKDLLSDDWIIVYLHTSHKHGSKYKIIPFEKESAYICFPVFFYVDGNLICDSSLNSVRIINENIHITSFFGRIGVSIPDFKQYGSVFYTNMAEDTLQYVYQKCGKRHIYIIPIHRNYLFDEGETIVNIRNVGRKKYTSSFSHCGFYCRWSYKYNRGKKRIFW